MIMIIHHIALDFHGKEEKMVFDIHNKTHKCILVTDLMVTPYTLIQIIWWKINKNPKGLAADLILVDL